MGTPPEVKLASFRWIVVNSSGGKDSQTALRVVVEMADRQAVPRSRIIVSHQNLGEMEWPGTLELVTSQARHYGLALRISHYRNKAGEAIDLLEYVRRRRKWPSSKQRFCTSEFKRGPGGRVLVHLFRESPGPILNVYGFRADESPARAKKPALAPNHRFSSQARQVTDWLPIHDWTEAQVWQSIRESSVPHHPAYDLGMPRLSCCFCIFAPQHALAIAARANPKLLDRYCAVEKEIGHDFKQGQPLRALRHSLK